MKASEIIALVPAVITVVKAVEEAIPGTGKGEEKLAATREILETVYEDMKGVWPIIMILIAKIVGIFNRSGVFQKTN